MKTRSGVARAFAWNQSQQLRGWSFFSKDVVPFPGSSRQGNRSLGRYCFCFLHLLAAIRGSGASILCLYTIAQQPPTTHPQGGSNETGLLMQPSPDGKWVSGPLPLTYSGKIGDMLFVRFRIVYTQDASQISDTSRTYSFNMEGRPDLSFMTDVPRTSWFHDSIHVDFTVSTRAMSQRHPSGYFIF